MTEKLITLEDVSLVDFFGPKNENLEAIKKKFPEAKIISRGEDLKISGSKYDVILISDVFEKLVLHYNRYNAISLKSVDGYLSMNIDEVEHDANSKVIMFGAKGNAIKPRSLNQKNLVETAYNNDLVFAVGPAGTGKTFIAVALAVKALKDKEVKKIIITRPAVEAGESLGFLPGDMKDKVDPYLRPIYDALYDLLPGEKVSYYKENRIIEIAPLAYMRGRTLSDAFVLLDEAQNTTTMQIKMFMTRLGPNSKMIITGDPSQVDLPGRQKSGLVDALDKLKGVEGVGVTRLDSKDVVRHRVVKGIIDAYNRKNDD